MKKYGKGFPSPKVFQQFCNKHQTFAACYLTTAPMLYLPQIPPFKVATYNAFRRYDLYVCVSIFKAVQS
jgi:hypothetical protein